jgi:CRP-like cAMP-binding protein
VLVNINTINETTETIIQKQVTELQLGDAFGELALIYGAKRAATCICGTPVELIILRKKY